MAKLTVIFLPTKGGKKKKGLEKKRRWQFLIHHCLYKSLLALTSFKIGILLNVPKILVYPQIQCLCQVILKIMLSCFLPLIIFLRTFVINIGLCFPRIIENLKKCFVLLISDSRWKYECFTVKMINIKRKPGFLVILSFFSESEKGPLLKLFSTMVSLPHEFSYFCGLKMYDILSL